MVPDIALLNKHPNSNNNNNSILPESNNSLAPSSSSSSSLVSETSPSTHPNSSNVIFSNNTTNNSNNHANNNNRNPSQPPLNNNSQLLPAISCKNQIIDFITKNKTTIIIGETGSGKTTQIPRFIYENLTSKMATNKTFKGTIGITQPRRVAAVSVAKYVANEMKCSLGTLVGYKIRFEDCTNHLTKIKYMTDGILLREAISDPLLSHYRYIILDEAHERTIQSDVLFGILKKAKRLREKKRKLDSEDDYSSRGPPPLKIIIMSAKMDVDHFKNYFDEALVGIIPGRVYPIEIFYSEVKQSDYKMAALLTLFQIHREEDELTDDDDIGGDILVFCTGQDEIDSLIKTVKDLSPQINEMKTPKGNIKTLKPYPLYSALPMENQKLIFQTKNDCFRRVIFATNIAETSITIPNIRFVIDTGKVKSKYYSPQTGLEMMCVENISQAQAFQRAGRAGRLAPGKCYRLYTYEEYISLREHSIPEIQKCNLSSIILQMIASGISDIQEFDFIDPPSNDLIKSSLCNLLKMNAIEKIDNDQQGQHYRLTGVGSKMVKFPVDPIFALLIINSQKYFCTEEIITIISFLSVDNIFFVPSNEKEKAKLMHKKFSSSEGDLIRYLNIYRRFKELKQSQQNKWCLEHCIRYTQIKMACKIRQQLLEICRIIEQPIFTSSDTETIRKCLSIGSGVGIGLGANVAILQRNGEYQTVPFGNHNASKMVHIHPTSCLFSHHNKPQCLLFVDLIVTNKCYIRNLCLIDEEWLKQE